MAFISDLKFLFNDGYYHCFTEIILTKKIPFVCDLHTHNIVKLTKIGKSWKAVDEWGNHWTISVAPNRIQSVIYSHIVQMFDNRVNLNNIDYDGLSF